MVDTGGESGTSFSSVAKAWRRVSVLYTLDLRYHGVIRWEGIMIGSNHLFEGWFRDVGKENGAAFTEEEECCFEPDAARAAGYDGVFAGEAAWFWR